MIQTSSQSRATIAASTAWRRTACAASVPLSRTRGCFVIVGLPRLLAARPVASLAIYLSVGISGYLSFGSATAGDVLENFADKYPLAVGARAALLVVLASCYPKVQHSGAVRLAHRTKRDVVQYRNRVEIIIDSTSSRRAGAESMSTSSSS